MSAAYWTLVAALTLASPLHAHASPSYPAVLDDVLELGCSPSCNLCHVGKPGFATANTPLGIATRRAKLRCCDDDGLARVLAQLETSAIDSDGDGIGDIEELRARDDPNAPDTELRCERAELLGDGSWVFGSTCAAAPGPAGSAGLGTTLLVAAVLLVRRRRRRA
jgi:MYXO-CTERM domain-containing protein